MKCTVFCLFALRILRIHFGKILKKKGVNARQTSHDDTRYAITIGTDVLKINDLYTSKTVNSLNV